jgi:23S rRNA pseudouridine1911/1915/1917 synthase
VPEKISILVGSRGVGQRLDHHLNTQLEESRSLIKKWISEGYVLLNDRSVKAGYRLKSNDLITIQRVAPEISSLSPQPIPLNIVFEDDDLVVIDKQPGLVVHPGAGNRSGTLVNGLLYHFEEISHSQSVRPGIVHRLDKDTSGLLVVAKNNRAHDLLAQQFRERCVEKVYLTLVHGTRLQDSGEIDAPIGRHPKARTRMTIGGHACRPAKTKFLVKKRFSEFCFLKVELYTGRTHQIRVHMGSIGCPIAGDPLYGQGRDKQVMQLSVRRAIESLGRQFLHASYLRFKHPTSCDLVEFRSKLPENLDAILKLLE